MSGTKTLMRAFVKAVLSSGLSQAEISRRTGVHEHTLSIWMNGGGLPRLATLAYVLDILGYDLKIVKRDPAAKRTME